MNNYQVFLFFPQRTALNRISSLSFSLYISWFFSYFIFEILSGCTKFQNLMCCFMRILSRLNNVFGTFFNKAYLLELLHFLVKAAFSQPLLYSFTTNKKCTMIRKWFFLKIFQILQSFLFCFQIFHLEETNFKNYEKENEKNIFESLRKDWSRYEEKLGGLHDSQKHQ